MTFSLWPTEALHALQRRYLAEDLVRLRRSDERRRYAAPQRAAKIDPNPHQIEAVIFALARIREGGCILADEVGLGKTIETGLVIAQLLTEGASRVLLVAPKALLGQWRQELFTLFDIEAREGSFNDGGLAGPGVFLLGREQAGSERGSEALLAAGSFDLCVIDEAHEVFAAIYKRFDRFGEYKADAKEARTAGRLREVLTTFQTPVLLLTATPIQNNLAELWGLVQYVDPLGTLLGDLPTFREVFCGVDDRQPAPGHEEELRMRLKTILKRTLRRQAQEFMQQPFVRRQARLFHYEMSAPERALYDDVTRYLLEPGIIAFRGSHRTLLLIGFHRRMASSTRALATSLERVAARLRAELAEQQSSDDADVEITVKDLEETDIDELEANGEVSEERPPRAAVESELARVEDFVRRARSLVNDDGKLGALVTALGFVTDQARRQKGAGKLVVFTESLVTQDHIRERLLASGVVQEDEITLFRGTNASARVEQALRRWEDDLPKDESSKPSREMAIRLALVHEFKTRSRVFISTEAGAKGLNLQFCDALVNYDLPWNPQRIEQRIGRCHRYGQKNEVTVINFLAKDNEAQQLTFDILSQKLELFGTVLDASDHVLHHADASAGGAFASAIGVEFEAELRRIYERARTLDEVTAELRDLRERVAEERSRFEETHARTARLIEDNLDDEVKRVLRIRQDELPAALAELDRDLWAVVRAFLDAHSIPYELLANNGVRVLHVPATDRFEGKLSEPVTAVVGGDLLQASLHLRHPLVQSAVADARVTTEGLESVTIHLEQDSADELIALRGQRGRLRLVKATFDGFERVERLMPIVVLDKVAEPLPLPTAEALLRSKMRDTSSREPAFVTVTKDDLDDATDELLISIQREVDATEQERFERASVQAARFLEDRILVQQRRRAALTRQMSEAEARRDAAVGSVARDEAEARLAQLDAKLDEVASAIEALEAQDNEAFRLFHDNIYQRRFSRPSIEALLELELIIE